MAHVKNVGGGPGDEDPRPPPRQPTDTKGKETKKLADHVERGGARSGVLIADQLSPATRAALEQVERRHDGPARTVMVGGRRMAIDESQPQGESQ